jgi:hypothetical protein
VFVLYILSFKLSHKYQCGGRRRRLITRRSKASRRAAIHASVTLAVSDKIHVPWIIAFASLNSGVGQTVSAATACVESSRQFHSASLVQLWVYWKMSQKISVQVSRRINCKLTKDSSLFSERKITGSLIDYGLERKGLCWQNVDIICARSEASRRKSLTGQTQDIRVSKTSARRATKLLKPRVSKTTDLFFFVEL